MSRIDRVLAPINLREKWRRQLGLYEVICEACFLLCNTHLNTIAVNSTIISQQPAVPRPLGPASPSGSIYEGRQYMQINKAAGAL